MVDKISLTGENFKQIFTAFDHYYPEGSVYSADRPFSSGDFSWQTRRKFLDFISRLTSVTIDNEKDLVHIKQAQVELDLMEKRSYQEVKTEKATEQVNATLPGKDTRELQEEERIRRENTKKASDEQAKKDVEASIKRQQEIYAEEAKRVRQTETALKNEKIYVEAKKEEVLKTENVEKLRQQANANPQETAAIIEKTIKESIPTVPDVAAKQAAYDIVANLQTDGEPLRQTAIVSTLAANPKQIIESVKNKSSANDIISWTNVLSDSKLTTAELSQAITKAAFGESFQKEVLPKWLVTFSLNPTSNSQTYTFDQISKDYSSLIDRQSSFLDGLKSFGVEEVRAHISSKVNLFVAEQIKNLHATSSLRGFFDDKIVQACLPGARFANPAVWTAAEGNFFGKIAVGSGFAPALGWLGEKTGIDFGIKKVTQVAIKGGVEAATGTTLAATITAAFAWTGPLAPVIGVVGAFLIEMVGAEAVNKVVGWVKDNAQKYGKWIVGVTAGIIGFLFFGLTGGIVGFFGGFLAATALGGLSAVGATASAVASTASAAMGVVWSTFLAGVGIPILATLIGFPVVVALILFIINSGAYVVPPGQSLENSANPYIDVSKTANPPGPLTSPQAVTYTITVTAKKDDLTQISYTSNCSATKNGGGSLNCNTLDEQTIPFPSTINTGTPFTFTLISNYGPSYQDSLITNNITVNATSVSGGKVTETGSASVCFGKCPLDCFAFPDNYWPNIPDVQNLKSLLTGAASTLASEYPEFAKKVCSNGTVNLCYKPSVIPAGIFGWHEHSSCDIDFNLSVAKYGDKGTLFLLTHEVTHHIQKSDGHWENLFSDKVYPAESSVCTYGGTDEDETMAEGDALFVAPPIIDAKGSCITNYQSQYPLHYQFAKYCMFGAPGNRDCANLK